MQERLIKIFRALLDCYGKQYWWPADTKEEVIIGAVLTQNTNWLNVTKAIDNLKSESLCSLELLASVPADKIAALIRPSGYYNLKADRLKNVANSLLGWEPLSLDKEEARNYLLSIKGVGQETADSILLYAYDFPYFVVDSYTIRLSKRLGLLNGDTDYLTVQKLFMENLPSEPYLFNEYHALIVKHCKTHCRKTAKCGGCPLATYCTSYSYENVSVPTRPP